MKLQLSQLLMFQSWILALSFFYTDKMNRPHETFLSQTNANNKLLNEGVT